MDMHIYQTRKTEGTVGRDAVNVGPQLGGLLAQFVQGLRGAMDTQHLQRDDTKGMGS